jgi:hypothetical protein
MFWSKIRLDGAAKPWEHPHFPKIYDLPLLGHWVGLNHCNRGADAQSPVQDVHSKDDRVSLTEGSDDLEPAWPDSLRSSIFPLGLDYFGVVLGEGIEEMVDDVGCKTD